MKCPVCDADLAVDLPRRGARWTAAQVAFLRRLVALGVSLKGCAFIFRSSVGIVSRRLHRPPSVYDRGRWMRIAARDARGRLLPKNGIQGEQERL